MLCAKALVLNRNSVRLQHGEISMLYGLGVWESMSNMSDILNRSKLFEERLAGPMNAVREPLGFGS
ncbi:MAG: hypothetical protein Ct9H300mP21_02580 [Pseudomonadota bacterium]|nr:MAG: hypothetical protein Ct9H300mP21_02580 [Pseudomonadota bacterium]